MHRPLNLDRCLQENLEQPDMSQECKDEVARSTRQQGRDYRLNWRLNDACGSDIARLCSHQCTAGGHVPCGGLVLRCLQVRRLDESYLSCLVLCQFLA